MKVLLQRNLFLNGVRYRRDRYGTDLPDEVSVKKNERDVVMKPVVLWEGEDGKQDEAQAKDAKAGKIIVLPRDAVAYEQPGEEKRSDFVRESRSPQVALSELGKGKTKGISVPEKE